MPDDAEYEVVRSIEDGWGVRRKGEPQNLSHHDTREQAEEAARLHSEEGAAVDVRKDLTSDDPAQGVDAKRTFGLLGVMVVSVFLLIALVAVLLVLTDTTV